MSVGKTRRKKLAEKNSQNSWLKWLFSEAATRGVT